MIRYLNQDFLLKSMRTTPDHALKNLILTGIFEGNQTLPTLREYVGITPYVHNGDAHFYNNESGLTSGINYLKSRGFITIYPKDGMGRPIKAPKPKRPYIYHLNERAYQFLSNPNHTADYKEQIIEEMANGLATEIIENDSKFKELVEQRVREMKPIKVQNQIEKPEIKPINHTIKLQMDDGTEKELELDSSGEIKEVVELKAQINQLETDHTATIREYEKYVWELESTLSQSDIEAVKKFERNLSREDKIQHRYTLATEYWNNGYYLDEYFFQQWNGDYIIAILKKLMELGQVIATECIDIFSKNSDLYKRRQSRIKRIVTGEDIIDCEFYVKELTDSGVVVGSPYLEEDKTLKW